MCRTHGCWPWDTAHADWQATCSLLAASLHKYTPLSWPVPVPAVFMGVVETKVLSHIISRRTPCWLSAPPRGRGTYIAMYSCELCASIVCCLSNKNQLYLAYCIMYIVCIQLFHFVLLTLQSRSLFLLSGTTPTGVDLFRLSIDSKMDSLLPWKHKRKQVSPEKPLSTFPCLRVLFIKNLDLCCAV